MFRSILVASAIATATFAAAGAYAQDDNSRAVSTRGVDFNNPSDVHVLYGHIRDAADEVCDGQGVQDMFTAKLEKACEDKAVNDAVSNLNQPQLTQLAQHRHDDSQMAMRDRHDSDARGTR